MKSSGVGEVAFGAAVTLLGVVQVGGDAGDGAVVGCAVWFELGELPIELVDSVADLGVSLFVCGEVSFGVGVLVAGVAVEVPEPVGDLATSANMPPATDGLQLVAELRGRRTF